MNERYPGYDVLSKRDSPSWNDQTRRVIDARMAIDPGRHEFFDDEEWATLLAVCARITPQPKSRSHPAPVAAMLDLKLQSDDREGYRDAHLPPQREAWRNGLRAIQTESRTRHGWEFAELDGDRQDVILKDLQEGRADPAPWAGMIPKIFFEKRLLPDIVSAYYAHPVSWNEIGFGGPASPRGYVRMNFDRRDPWEASEGRPGRELAARRENARVG